MVAGSGLAGWVNPPACAVEPGAFEVLELRGVVSRRALMVVTCMLGILHSCGARAGARSQRRHLGKPKGPLAN